MQLEDPYGNLVEGEWLRGNLHTHSTQSDGGLELQEVINGYADAGYDFLMMSDHDVYSSRELYDSLDNRGLILIPGNEVTRGGCHVLHVNADRLVEPDEDRQQVMDSIDDARGFAVVAHPNWYREFNHCSHEQLRTWTGYAGIEIYNGVIGRLEGSPYATNHWDRLLSAGRRVWGYANDDMHQPAEGDLGLGWNMVYARERSPDAVSDALQAGHFYASTGVTITGIEVDGPRVRITTDDAVRIVALRDGARRIAVVDGPVAEVDAPDDTSYIRFECWGTGEQFAWTQPFFTSW